MPENLLRILEVAGAIAVGVLALPWVFGPLLVKFSQRMRANPKLIPLDTQAFPLPQPLASSFSRDIACLEGVGFTLVSYATVPDVSPGVMSVVVILENRASQDLAMIATIFAVSRFSEITAGATPRSQHVEFSTEFSDGTEISTNNNRMESAFAPVAHKRVLQFHDVAQPDRLYRVHSKAIAEYARASKKPLPATQDVLPVVRRDLAKEMADQIETGFLYLDEEDEVYRPTWKGALLMTWKNCWPATAIRRASRRRRANQLLAWWSMAEAE